MQSEWRYLRRGHIEFIFRYMSENLTSSLELFSINNHKFEYNLKKETYKDLLRFCRDYLTARVNHSEFNEQHHRYNQ